MVFGGLYGGAAQIIRCKCCTIVPRRIHRELQLLTNTESNQRLTKVSVT